MHHTLHRFFEPCTHLSHIVCFAFVFFLFRRERPVFYALRLASLFYRKVVPRGEALDARKKRFLTDKVAIAKIRLKCSFVQLSAHARMLQKRFYFRAENERVAGVSPIERLDAKLVARDKQFLRLCIPYGKSEHSIELIEALRTIRRKGVEQDFGI